MRTQTVDELLSQAGRMAPAEQLRLLEGLSAMLEGRLEAEEPLHDITELRGLGRDAWRDPRTGELIDAQEYVNRERESWGG